MVIFHTFSTECIYSNVEISCKCNAITSFIAINPLVVWVICIYPPPSTSPAKKAKKDEGIVRYFSFSNLSMFLPFFKAFLCTVPITGKALK